MSEQLNTIQATDALQQYETQIRDILSAQYVDQSILLGLINLSQSKVLSEIFNLVNADPLTEELIDESITQVISIWSKLQYKVVNFFKLQHKVLFAAAEDQIQHNGNKKKKPQQKDEGGNHKPKLNSVEMRKLNETYLKFNGQVNLFYYKVINFFLCNFQLNKLPPKFVSEYTKILEDLDTTTTTSKPVALEIQWKIILILHQSLLSLGNLSRTRTLIELNYLKPSLSVRNYYAFQKDNLKKSKHLEAYANAFKYYETCILLDPNLNEPYNHIGMIYNSNEDYFNACYWFVRSQSTLTTTFQIGLNNLQLVMRKDEFKSAVLTRRDDVDVVFMCIIGYYYLPEVYSEKGNPRNVTKSLRYADLELRFWLLIEKLDLSKVFNANNATDNLIFKHLVLLISFRKLINKDSYDNFVIRHLSKVMTLLDRETSSADVTVKQNKLICLRLIFSIFREVKELRNKVDMTILLSIVNRLLKEQQGLNLTEKPTRSILFEEDVGLKGLSIKEYTKKRELKDVDSYAFNDFQDSDLLKTEDRGLLYGDLSCSRNQEGVPYFIANMSELNQTDDSITTKVIQYKNNLREQSLIVLGKKLLEISKKFKFDSTENKFIVIESTKSNEKLPNGQKRTDNNRKAEVKTKILKSDKQPSRSKRETVKVDNNKKDKNPGATSNVSEDKKPLTGKSKMMTVAELENLVSMKEEEISSNGSTEHSKGKKEAPVAAIPDSLEEIESFILQHTSLLHQVMNPTDATADQEKLLHVLVLQEKAEEHEQGDGRDANSQTEEAHIHDKRNIVAREGLQNMVDSLALENPPSGRTQVQLQPHGSTNAEFQPAGLPAPNGAPFQQHIPAPYLQYTQAPPGQQIGYERNPNELNPYPLQQAVMQPFQAPPMYGNNGQFGAPPMFGNGTFPMHSMPQQQQMQQPVHHALPYMQHPVQLQQLLHFQPPVQQVAPQQPYPQPLFQQPFQQPFHQPLHQPAQPVPQPIHQHLPLASTNEKPGTGFSKQYYYNLQKSGYQ